MLFAAAAAVFFTMLFWPQSCLFLSLFLFQLYFPFFLPDLIFFNLFFCYMLIYVVVFCATGGGSSYSAQSLLEKWKLSPGVVFFSIHDQLWWLILVFVFESRTQTILLTVEYLHWVRMRNIKEELQVTNYWSCICKCFFSLRFNNKINLSCGVNPFYDNSLAS